MILPFKTHGDHMLRKKWTPLGAVLAGTFTVLVINS